MEFHDAADVGPNMGIGNAICGYAIIGKHTVWAEDKVLVWSNTYIDFLPMHLLLPSEG